MVAELVRYYLLTNLITGFEKKVRVQTDEHLAEKIRRFVSSNSITEDDIRIEQVEPSYRVCYYFNGVRFISQTVMYRYQDLLYLKATGAITNLRVKPQYDLVEAFCYNGYEFRKLFYQANLEYYDTVKQRLIIEDYRGVSSNIPYDRAKTQLFLHMYKDKADIEFIHRDIYKPIKKRPTALSIEESNDRKNRLQNNPQNI